MRRILAIVVWLAAVQSALATEVASLKGTVPFSLTRKLGQSPQNALEERLFRDAADGRLDEFSPLGASLVAGGVQDDDALRHYEQKAAALVDELRRSGRLVGTQRSGSRRSSSSCTSGSCAAATT